MAYTNFQNLDSDVIVDWTPEDEASLPTPFYPEDIILIQDQNGFKYFKKCKVKFWGKLIPAFIGMDSNDKPLRNLIAFGCPPLHPPHGGFPGRKVNKEDKPAGFDDFDFRFLSE